MNGLGDAIGTFNIVLTNSSIEDDHGNNATGSTQLSVGETKLGTIEYVDDSNFLTFPVKAGQVYRIDSESTGTPFQFSMWLLDTGGQWGLSRQHRRSIADCLEDPEFRDLLREPVKFRNG